MALARRLGRAHRQPSVDVDRPRARRRPRNRSDCRARTRTRTTTRTNCGAAAPFSQRSLREGVGAYGTYIAREFAMLVTDGSSAGARASSPAELPMCSGTPAGQDARAPMLRRSRPFLAAKSARKRSALSVRNCYEKQEVACALVSLWCEGSALAPAGVGALPPSGRPCH